MYRLLPLILVFFLPAIGNAQGTYARVYDIFQQKCVTCHNPVDRSGGLDLQGNGATLELRQQAVYADLVGKVPQNAVAAAKGDLRIMAGRMDHSFLFRKINGDLEPTLSLDANEGGAMPDPVSGYVLSDLEKELIRQWILYGAPATGQVVSESVLEDYYTNGGQEAFPAGPPPAPMSGEGFQIKMGPFFLEKGGEIEYFQKWALDLPADVDVNRIDFQISNYSHHFLLYYFENGGSTVSDGLRLDQNHSDIGLFAAVQEKIDLDLPQGSAFRWGKDIVLDLNSHYINYSFTQVYKAEVYLNVYTQPGGTAAQEMYSTLLPNLAIYIPNDGTPRTFQQPIVATGSEIYLWGMMGHTHKYGTGYKAYLRNANGTKGDLIYDASCAEGIPGCVSPYFDYQHIPMRYFSPLFPLKVNPGIIHEATYVNDGPRPVRWGPTSDDEMMLMILMYTRDTAGIISAVRPEVKDPVQALFWPNPSNDRWLVELPGEVPGWHYNLYRPDGSELRHGPVDVAGHTGMISAGGLAPGMYFCRLQHPDGRVITGRLVRSE